MKSKILLAALIFVLLCTSCAAPAAKTTVVAQPKPSATAFATPTAFPTHTPTATQAATLTPTIIPTPTSTPWPTWAAPTLVPSRPEAISPENSADVREVGLLSKGMMLSMDTASAAGQIAIASHLGTTIYDSRNLAEIAFVRTSQISVGLAISADGKLLAGSATSKYGVEESGYFVNIWDSQTRAEKLKIQVDSPAQRKAFAPDNQRIAIVFGEGPTIITLFGLGDGKPTCTLTGHSGAINGLVFSPDGATLYSSAVDNTIRAWNVAKCAQDWQLDQAQNIEHMALSGDGSVLVSTSQNKVFRWKSQDGSTLGDWIGANTGITAISMNQDASRIYVGDSNGFIYICNNRGESLYSLQAHPDRVGLISFVDEAHLVMISGGEIIAVDPQNGALITSRGGYNSSISQISISPDGAYLAALDGNVAKVWETATGKLQATIKDSPKFALFTVDGKRLLVGTGKKPFQLYSAVDGAFIEAVRCGVMTDIGAVSPDGSLFAVGSAADGIEVYKTNPIELLIKLENSEKAGSISIAPDAKTIVAGLSTGQIRTWSLPEGKMLTTLYKDTSLVDVAYSQDGAFLFTKSRRMSPRLWNTKYWQLLNTYNQGSGRIEFGTGLSPTNQVFGVSTMDFANYIKDARDGRILATFKLDYDIANAVIFSPDGSRMYAAGGYGMIYVYAIPQ